MSDIREVELPSGAKLVIQLAPWAESKALWQAMAAELRDVQMSSDMEITAWLKDVMCAVIASASVEAALEKCLRRCRYNDMRIDKDTFEPADRRSDYMKVCVEVAKDNVGPFMKNLFADFKQAMSIIGSFQQSTPPTMI